MIVKRTYGIYRVSYRLSGICMYVLSEQGRGDWWGSSHGVAAEIDRREKQKELIEFDYQQEQALKWND